MSADRDETLRQFCDVTGADETRSKFFLDSSNWQLEVALSSFYEHGGNTDDAPPPSSLPAPVPVLSDSDMDSPPISPVAPQKKDKKPKKPSNTKFATLDSLQQESSSDEEEESKYGWIRNKMRTIVQNFFYDEPCCSKTHEEKATCIGDAISSTSSQSLMSHLREKEEEVILLRREMDRLKRENEELKRQIAIAKRDELNDTGQAFYAGGSERSGQQILGPGKSRKDIVTEMFKSVRERGAVSFEDEPMSARGAGGAGGTFAGVGYRLGQTADDHEPVVPSNAQSQSGPRSVRLRLYREGFSVDDGPLRHYADPENAGFLDCVRRGEIPAELSHGGAEVRVSLEDRRHEECPRDQPRGRPFTGKGHMLGSPTPATVGATVPIASASSDRAANERAAQTALKLDDNKPTTTIQFRLADGSRLSGRFNHTHTVADLRQFLTTAAPQYQLQSFALMTTFPSAELNDQNVTVQQANLLNSLVVQRLK